MSAEETGRRVLAGLAKGRERAIEAAKAKGRDSARLVYDLAMLDEKSGGKARGRAARIARRLRWSLSERQILRILDTLFCVSE